MKILNLEGSYFIKELKKRGHDVLSIGYDDCCDIKIDKLLSSATLLDILKSRNFYPDLILWNDVCKLPGIFGFELLPCVIIGYSIDQYCNPWHVPYFSIFEGVFIAQLDYLSLFKKEYRPQIVQWLPLFFDPDIAYFNENEIRDIPVSFVGTVEGSINKDRKNFLIEFSKHLPIVIKQGNYQPIYSRSKIVLNQSAAGELNFRIFEAMACGAVILTEDIENGLKKLFKPEKEILIYKRGDVLDAVRVCKQWLTSEKLNEIATAGHEKVKKYHSVSKRVDKILKLAEKLILKRSYEFRLKNKKLIFDEIAKALLFITTDKELSIPNYYRNFLIEIAKYYLDLPKFSDLQNIY